MNLGRRTNKYFSKDYIKQNYLIIIIALISIIGIITAGSAIQTRTYKDSQLFADEFFKQILSGFILGIFLAYITYIIGLERILKFKRVMLGLSLLTLLYLAIPTTISNVFKIDIYKIVNIFSSMPIKPVIRNGAIRWLSFGPIQFQPVELVKITLLLYMANYFKELDKNELNWDYLKRPLYIFLISSFFILIQPDLGSVVIITLMFSTILFLLKISIKRSIIILSLLALFSSFSILVTPYRRERVMGWLTNTNIQKNDSEYLQIKKVQDAIKRGGFFGVGYTNGVIKYNIPEVSSDAILAVLGEEFGILSIVFLILLYSSFFIFCIQKSFEINNISKKIVIIGIGSWIFYQAMWNIGGVVGLIPLKGLPLPFVSEGGTSVAVSMIGIGLIFTCLKVENLKRSRY
jgi:cell division protein FtsW